MKAKFISIACAVLVTLIGCFVELGWAFHIPTMIQIIPDYVGMVFNTAFLFTLAGVAIFLANFNSSAKINLILKIIGPVISVFAAVSLSQNVFQYNTGIDET